MTQINNYLSILDTKYVGDFNSDPYDFGFELDDFQKHAITSIKNNENVLVTAHTGSGKTVPAIFGIADSLAKNKKIVYTSPIKSLSNQKFYELKQKFPDVGILTGDIKFNPDAQCLIMTTEILRNILYQKTSQHVNLEEIDKIIFDEVHYINDPDRGRVWEECIILSPPEITLIMLSATIDEADKFAGWIGNIKKKMTNLIPTTHRVVPLEHFFYFPEYDNHSTHSLKKIVSHNGTFQNYNEIKKEYHVQHSSKIINKVVSYLKQETLVPALFFVFSRKETEKLAKGIHISLVSSQESAEIDKIFNFELRQYKETYKYSPQFHEIHQLVLKGIAYHHSGLIPILKEVIEILFAKSLIKVLIATETFAVGVNMPTKTVVFPKLQKYSKGGFRSLRTDEYLQMAGRAGRRGLDKFGTVILLPNDELMEYPELKKMMTGKSPKIESKFKLNYQFILKILNNKEQDLNQFVHKSLFSEGYSRLVKKYQKELQDLKNFDAGFASGELGQIKNYHRALKVLNNAKGNYKKKEQTKVNQIKKDIQNFHVLNKKYLALQSNQERMSDITKAIDGLETTTHNQIDKIINYLKDNHYIHTETNKLLKKGIMASEISECNEIVLTEIVTNDFFAKLKPEEIVAVLAVFIEEKGLELPGIEYLNISPNLKKILGDINYLTQEFGSYEYNCYIDIETDWNIYLSFVNVAYDWASGVSMAEILGRYYGIYEGTFIRNILRISNIVDNIRNIADMIDDVDLLQRLEGVNSLLIRDQVTTESLYIMKE